MINESILDSILPVPTEADLKDEIVADLENEGFVITNYNSGGVFYTLMMLMVRAKIELRVLLRTVLSNMFISYADDAAWLELKATDYGKTRKQPVKAQGVVAVSRADASEAATIPKGYIFKTLKDINGDELRYVVADHTVIQQGVTTGAVPVEAENTGAQYNVPAGQITVSLIHLEGVDSITNASDWLTREGSDLEDIEAFRSRILNSWADLATMPTAAKYKSVCEAVDGVLHVQVNDQHPRGQGTIDIIVTSTAGAATEALLDAVTAAARSIAGPYDDLLIKSATVQAQDITLAVTVTPGTNTDGMSEKITAIVILALAISTSRNLNELMQADLIYAIKRDVPLVRNVRVMHPASDVVLDADKVLIPGAITVNITEG